MRNKVVLAIVTVTLLGCDKHEKRETKHDNGQLKEKFSVLETKDGSFIKDGAYNTWYDSGQPESTGQFEEGKKIGNWKTWYKNGQMKSDVNYTRDTLDGKYIVWYENGQKMEEGTTQKSIKVGEYTSWYENGQMKSKFTFAAGKKEGPQVSWYQNGQKASDYTLVNGKPNGEFKTWSENGKLAVNRFFKNELDTILPRAYKNSNGSTIEILQDETFKLKILSGGWFYSEWLNKPGKIQISQDGHLFAGDYEVQKFNRDTLILNIYNGAELNVFKALAK